MVKLIDKKITAIFRKLFLLNWPYEALFFSSILVSVSSILVSVASVKEVRSGKTTDALKNKDIAGIYPDECAFSIVFGDNFESMDLIANTPDEANIWVTGLTCLINTSAKATTCTYMK